MRRAVGVTLLLLLLGGVASTPAVAAPAAGGSEPASAMCREHGVLEAVCTKCNPALIPVFQAKGDWCAEHGFPESFCPICHPERGGMPKADVSNDGAPPDGTMVRFKTKDTARLAGLETALAEEQPKRVEVDATVRIVFDATRVAQVNARAAGVVRSLLVDVGTTVGENAPLAVVESAEVGAELSRQSAARAKVEVAEANLQRVSSLHAEGIAPKRDVLASRQELEAARAELATAKAALGVVEPDAKNGSRYTVTTPMAGVVTRREVTIGHLVSTAELMFEVVDTSKMWAEIDVPEALLGSVSVGQAAVISIDGLGEREFPGVIAYVAPSIDSGTRTATVRVALDNPDGALRANMFGRATITVSNQGSWVVVPATAVQRAPSNTRLVFVRKADDAYEARRVQVASRNGDRIAVSGRIAPGDEVVTTGSFLLKTETLKGSIGAGCCADD